MTKENVDIWLFSFMKCFCTGFCTLFHGASFFVKIPYEFLIYIYSGFGFFVRYWYCKYLLWTILTHSSFRVKPLQKHPLPVVSTWCTIESLCGCYKIPGLGPPSWTTETESPRLGTGSMFYPSLHPQCLISSILYVETDIYIVIFSWRFILSPNYLRFISNTFSPTIKINYAV